MPRFGPPGGRALPGAIRNPASPAQSEIRNPKSKIPMTHYSEELTKLKESLLAMASHAESAVARAIRALVERDETLAQQVEEDDNILDQFEIEIDDTAIHLLAKAPLATDLRLITVAMKISQNLERVGDEAVTIARRAIELNAEPQLKPYIDLPRMASTRSRPSFIAGRKRRARWCRATKRSTISTGNYTAN